MTFFDTFCIIIIEVVIMHQSKSYSDYKEARNKAWDIIFRYEINQFPVQVKELCERMGVMLYTYRTGAGLIKDYKLTPYTVNEGFSMSINGHMLIFYDEEIRPHARKRFTVAHELGHVVMGHLADDSAVCRGGITLWNRGEGVEPAPEEISANVFASRLLAPACVLHALDIHTAGEIASLCGLSYKAAEVRAKRMAELYARERDWLRTKGRSCFGVSPQERRALEQFKEFIKEYREK